MKKTILSSALLAVLMCVSGGAQASLVGRDINGNAVAGNDAISVFLYDTVLDVTWLRNTNANGLMNWSQANTWATNLVMGAYDGWRLPTIQPINGTSFNYNFTNDGTSDKGYGAIGVGWGTASEMGHLFYVTLGNIPGSLSNTGDFQNLEVRNYWYGSADASDTGYAWGFNTGYGTQDYGTTSQDLYALAVRSGDVAPSAVPVPAAAWLMASGLGALGVAARKRRAKAA